jgi:murein DD-endopeptidase MepM/ murein hydrolase activator NlpD
MPRLFGHATVALAVSVGLMTCTNNPQLFGYKISYDAPVLSLSDKFGVLSFNQLSSDIKTLVHGAIINRQRFQLGISSIGLLRPSQSLPAYLSWTKANGLTPIYNYFDRTGGGKYFSQRVTRANIQDFRRLSVGQSNSYDEHDGVDFVAPIGTPLVASAPGRVAMVRFNWLRGGTTGR